jgi:polyisoprenoid-binding protein YceI
MDPSVHIAGSSARGTLDRTAFGMKYAEGAIGSEIKLVIEVEGIKQ